MPPHSSRSERPPRTRSARAWALAALPLASGCALRTRPTPPFAPRCTTVAADGWGPPGTTPIRVETVVRGLRVPWSIAFLPGGNEMLVTERGGAVRRVRDGRLLPEPVVRVPVTARSEEGLLGIALHPAFATTRLFYVYYTRDGGRGVPVNRVERYRLDPSGARATPDRVLLDGVPASRFHNGGRLRFGPDGLLYIGTGDAYDPPLARDRRSPAGKILRLTPDGAVPRGNPFGHSAVFALGVRNAAAFDWLDRDTLVLADHGPSGELFRTAHDEVSLVRAGDDLGWPAAFGCEARAGLVAPLLAWSRAAPPGGAAVYTGAAIPEWRGSVLIATLASRHLHRVLLAPLSAPPRVIAHEVYLQGDPPAGYGRLRDAVMGPDGELYLTTSNCDGRGTCPPDGDRILRVTR